MAPSIAWEYLTTSKSLKVLDPMVGSGTTVTIAKYLGHKAFGIDTDPLAVTIASAWSSNINHKLIRNIANIILYKAKQTVETLNTQTAFPIRADIETKKFIGYWFDLRNRKELTALSKHISGIRDVKTRQILWTAFSRMIITKNNGVSLAMDVSHSRPHKVYTKAPHNAFDIFLKSVETLIAKAPFTTKISFHNPETNIIYGDSRMMPYSSNYFDIVITSPPYLNAIDYFRASKLSLVWMGNSINIIKKWRSTNIGAEVMFKGVQESHIRKAIKEIGEVNCLPSREKGFAFRYIVEMDKVMKEIGRVSKKKGKIIMVVGNSTLKNVYINNSAAIISLGLNHNLKLVKQTKRKIPDNKRYLPAPSHKKSGVELKGRMRNEVVLEFVKK
jgi:DNA modification methylase